MKGQKLSNGAQRLPVLVVCLWVVFSGYGQFTNGRLIDERSGLSDVQVRVIEKDHNGFLWIGTRRGLNRFDGSQIRQFLHDPNDPASILNNEINDIVADSHTLWVGGPYGISSLDMKSFSITNIQFDCSGIIDSIDLIRVETPKVSFLHLEDSILWISTRECGLIRYNTITRNFMRISFAGHRREIPDMISSKALEMIVGFTEDREQDSIFWIGTSSGLIRFNNKTLTHRLYYKRDPNLLYQDAINVFRRVLHHDDGMIYYITWGWGANVFDPQTEQFFSLPLEGVTDRNLKHHVGDVRRHDALNLWIRTPDGIHLYNTGLQKIIAFNPNEDKTALYRSVDFVDEAGRNFFSSNNGIYIYDPLHEQFLVFSYEHLNVPDWHGFARKVVAHPDGLNITILGQSVDALYHFDHKKNTWFESRIPGLGDNPEEGFNGMDMAPDEKFGWVFSGSAGVYRFNPETFEVREIDLGINLTRKRYEDIEWDHTGMLWIGTRHEGLLKYNPGTRNTTQYKEEIYGTGLIHTMPSATNLYCDSGGNMWFVTGNGHSVYSPKTGSFYNFGISEAASRTLTDLAGFVEDGNGVIWSISHAGMLAKGRADRPQDGLEFQLSVFQNRLSPSYVEGIVYGDDGNLYVLCESALIRFDSTYSFSIFSFDYAPFMADFFSFDKLSETSLVVGLRNSFAVLHSTGLRRNFELPQPYLTEITINEKPLTGNFIVAPTHLDLRHNENFLSFSFSAVSYTLPERNHFRYRLASFDPDWIDAGTRRFANYTNIPSGEYSFELQVANNEGLWNPSIYRVPMLIARPWWSTWWFRAAAFIFILSTVIGIYRWRIAQIRKEAKLKSEFERKIGDVELSALKAQMNPHFIFNCLNSIENYILKNESIKAAEYINDFARLIRLILQNSRSQYISLKDEIEALDLYLQMESLRFDNKFEYQINVDPDLEVSDTDIPPMLIQPFIENAIWHGLIPKNAPGKLDIDITRENGALQCIIQDNGIGRKKSKEINASMYKRGKKSMGMLITKNRIDVYNELYQTSATVRIHDLEDANGQPTGTRVELKIPIE